MLREMPLIATIVGGLGLAFVFGAIANRFRIPPIVGYLFAGIAVGTFTLGSLPTRDWPVSLPSSA
jgi:CPA2 family monovalent cation:H+ antiporter-2